MEFEFSENCRPLRLQIVRVSITGSQVLPAATPQLQNTATLVVLSPTSSALQSCFPAQIGTPDAHCLLLPDAGWRITSLRRKRLMPRAFSSATATIRTSTLPWNSIFLKLLP